MSEIPAPARRSLLRRRGSLLLAAAAIALPRHQAAAALPTPTTQLETRGIDHIGINVPDADVAIAFFRNLLGANVISDMRPADAGVAWKRRFRWHSTARLRRMVMIAIPGGEQLELFQYDTPEGRREHPHQDDIGATHIALKASDVGRSIAVLKTHGVTILNDPVMRADGSRWFYFLTPWGAQMELVFPPDA